MLRRESDSCGAIKIASKVADQSVVFQDGGRASRNDNLGIRACGGLREHRARHAPSRRHVAGSGARAWAGAISAGSSLAKDCPISSSSCTLPAHLSATNPVRDATASPNH